MEAYKRQNQFLSAELLEMNQLRSDDLAVNKQLVQLATCLYSVLYSEHCTCRHAVFVSQGGGGGQKWDNSIGGGGGGGGG